MVFRVILLLHISIHKLCFVLEDALRSSLPSRSLLLLAPRLDFPTPGLLEHFSDHVKDPDPQRPSLSRPPPRSLVFPPH